MWPDSTWVCMSASLLASAFPFTVRTVPPGSRATETVVLIPSS